MTLKLCIVHESNIIISFLVKEIPDNHNLEEKAPPEP